MSGDWDDDMCKKALMLLEELCYSQRGNSQSKSCQEFSYLHRGRNIQLEPGNAHKPGVLQNDRMCLRNTVCHVNQVISNLYGDNLVKNNHGRTGAPEI